MNDLFLGIDTSNYKTSIAITDINRNIVFQRSDFLNIKKGDLGLRQSDAFFQHSNKLSIFIEEAFDTINPAFIKAIGVSTQPRKINGSYMPCFIAGKNLARELSATLGIPLHYFSHQEGHAAAIIETKDSLSKMDSCLFFHLSGGTTEFLKCTKISSGYKMEILGGTKDISIGQLIDRIGVAMNYPFPSGIYIDNIAYENNASKDIIPRIKIIDSSFNLSGIETFILRYIENHTDSEIHSIISELFTKLSEVILKSAIDLAEKHYLNTVYIAGGVASSKTLRKEILNANNSSINIIFADPLLSGDNAIGISYLAGRNYKNR